MKNIYALSMILVLSGCAKNCTNGSEATIEPASNCSIAADRNLLIIGDSISMGYTPYVQKNLCGTYNVERVHYPKDIADGMTENARSTSHTLLKLEGWLDRAAHPLHVITWNNGLWNARDPATDPEAPGHASDLATYEADLITIGTRLVATGARVIFFTTTDIPLSGSTFIPGRDTAENIIANAVLPPLGIEVVDLNAFTRAHPELHPATDPIHFTDEGYLQLGALISNAVLD